MSINVVDGVYKLTQDTCNNQYTLAVLNFVDVWARTSFVWGNLQSMRDRLQLVYV